MIHAMLVVGARPNLMKIAPIVDEISKHTEIQQTLLHTGQHYDKEMSQIFFDELAIPHPDIYLGVGSGTHAEQTARIMLGFEKELLEVKPDIVVVVGDVNSTLACSIVAAKLSIPIAHVEAGLRSFDRKMPEEINRVVTDALSDILFTTSRDANENLIREGIAGEKIFFVGNVMIDTLIKHRIKAERLDTASQFGLTPGNYLLLTMHRPSNVDNPVVLNRIIDALIIIQSEIPILFPAHPRTIKSIETFRIQSRIEAANKLLLVPPQSYLAFLNLMINAHIVLTDSGGIQEETTMLGIPCLTLRKNTERPVTIYEGTNQIIGSDPKDIVEAVNSILNGNYKSGSVPELWDGKAAYRIVKILLQKFNKK